MREYDPKFQELDEQLCQLIADRFYRGGDKQAGRPSQEQLEEWSEKYRLEKFYLASFFSILTTPHGRPFKGPIHLRTVLPILRKAEQDGVVYEMTHMMQYENCSVIALDIRTTELNSPVQFAMPELILDIAPGEYHVTISNSRGGGNRFEMGFTVTPPLPDDLQELDLKLVPHQRFQERFAAKILNQVVEF